MTIYELVYISINTNDKLILNDGVEKIDKEQYKSLIIWLIYLAHSR